MSRVDYEAGDRSEAAMTHRQYLRQLERMSDHLRQYADRIDQCGRDVIRGDRPRYVMAVADVLSELNAMHGNAPTWSFVAAADDAQTAMAS